MKAVPASTTILSRGRTRMAIARAASHPILRSLLKTAIILWVVVTLTFLVIRALPGNPVDIFVQQLITSGLSEEQARARAAGLLRIDLDQPLRAQYLDFLRNLARGDLGDSYVLARGTSVRQIVMQRLPWTLFSVGTSLLVSFALGSFLGMLAAYRRGSWLDHALTTLSAILDAVPPILIAVLCVLLIGVHWKLLPLDQLRGSRSPGIRPGFTLAFFVDLIRHVLAPGAVYVLSTLGSWILAMRSSTLGTLGEEYVTVARARGLSDLRIMTAYVGRNASLPLVTGLAISLGFAVGGAIVIEQVFVYQGVGLLLSQAIARRDYPVIQGVLLVTTITVLLATGLADLLYSWLDPRVGTPGRDQ
ncbi:MAG TPA: ABC transporter permease [Herpetosiphonaceae bacterium]